MVRLFHRCAAALFLATLIGCAPSLRVMTFNVRYASEEGAHRWSERRPVMASVIRNARPDLIGTQELLQRQGDDLTRALPGYTWFGRDRRGGHSDEHMGIFYRSDRVRLLSQGDFWLSERPDEPGSMSWGTDLPRLANWGVFETLGRQKRRFVFVDTHFAHRPQDEQARERSVSLILARLPTIAAGLPVILAGDFNATPLSAAYSALASNLTDTWTTARSRQGPEQTFHDFTGVGEKRIDYLFLRGFRAEEVVTDTSHVGDVYPSDHFPVRAKLAFGR
ncbi:endonuclease/exonuclease/phosphatase family metal-dependent hydrolase [Sphingomonas aerophila]|uniref:Endonuclease/exonuclease/phosphatase family metal-dependent hydrolase n=2 Tax=Sphingomonas aerophila TaxID=1344948 RepID=A0A7W9EVZ0_9SPHN|nr:endonuclease/exonuclease/phosphatase family metal-dependent hydrolase [Sphingomonas aerophila]